MPRGNQHWIDELDFAIEEWTLDGVRLVEVLGRVHVLEMAHQAFVAAKKAAPGIPPPPSVAAPRSCASCCLSRCEMMSSAMRTRRPSREEAKPRRPKSPPGPTPTLGQIAAQSSWVWINCEARDCHHGAPLKLADAITRYGAAASSNVLRQRSRCTKCGAIGATLRLPSWADSLLATRHAADRSRRLRHRSRRIRARA
jgi:hypothetical protein